MPKTNTLQLFRTTTASTVPGAASLAAGELAVNLTDKKLFVGDAAGTSYIELTRRADASAAGSTALPVQLASTTGALSSSSTFTYNGTTDCVTIDSTSKTNENTLDLLGDSGYALRIAGGSGGGSAAVGAIRLGRSATATNNVLLYQSGGDFSIYQGINTSGTLLMATDVMNDKVQYNLSTISISSTAAGQIELRESVANGGTYFTGFKAPNLSANIIYTLPTADGSSGHVLSTNGSGTLSWTAVSGGLSWSAKTADATLTAEEGVLANKSAGTLTLTLPSTAALGKVIRVSGMQNTWRIAQNASQKINFGKTSTTTGTGGYLESTNARDAVELVCCVANTEWNVISSIGNITIV